VLVHQAAGAGAIAHLDQLDELPMDVEDAARDRRRQGRIACGPGHVLQREQLHGEHAVVRGLRHRQVEVAAGAGKLRSVAELALGVGEQPPQLGAIGRRRVLRGQLRPQGLHRTLRIEDLARADAVRSS
jgi:hypothetical protein